MKAGWVSCVLACVAISACGSSHDTLELDFTGRHLDEVEDRFPAEVGFSRLQSYIEGSGENRWQREVVIGRVAAECMRSAGYDYPDLRWTKDQIVADWTAPRFIPVAVAEAELVGYGPPPASLSTAPIGDDAPLELTGEALTRYLDQELECIVEGQERAFDDFDAYAVARETLAERATEFDEAFGAAEPVLALNAEWADCMSARGYEFDSPDAARATAWFRADGDDGRAIAVHDATCRAEFDYDREWWALYSSAEARFIVDNEELIVSVYDLGRVRP